MLFMVYYSLTHIQNLVMGTEWDSNMDIHQFHPLSYFLSLLIPFLGQTNLFFTKRHSPSILVFIPYLSTSKINIRKVWYIMLRTLFWSLTTNHRDSTTQFELLRYLTELVIRNIQSIDRAQVFSQPSKKIFRLSPKRVLYLSKLGRLFGSID